MNKLIFKKLFIFSNEEKSAKYIEFHNGSNMITSDSLDGNYRGKSLILKSLYHCMGADCYFSSDFKISRKILILEIEVKNEVYYIFRFNNLFKIFDSNKNLLFRTVSRSGLAKYFEEEFNFSIYLPNRKTAHLDIAPPAYSYVLNFVDQDYQKGTNFQSFKNLSQFKDYKENLLLCHFGIYDNEYFNIKNKLQELKDEETELNKKLKLIDNMISYVSENLKDISFPQNYDTLVCLVEKTREEYSDISIKLAKVKDKIISLENERTDILLSLSTLKNIYKNNENDIKSLNNNICPLCSSELESTVVPRLKKYNMNDDIAIISCELQESISSIDSRLEKETNQYKDLIESFNKYEEKLKIHEGKIQDILTHKGYQNMKDSLLNKYSDNKIKLSANDTNQKKLNKKLNHYKEKVTEVNLQYFEHMMVMKSKFNLEEITESNVKNIKLNFISGGSNKPITTILWYITLLKLKEHFNPNAMHFPIVFDSPANAEVDKDKKREVYSYIMEEVNTEINQLIVSGIGYNEGDLGDIKFDNVITLENAKRSLLTSEDYDKFQDLLLELLNADLNN